MVWAGHIRINIRRQVNSVINTLSQYLTHAAGKCLLQGLQGRAGGQIVPIKQHAGGLIAIAKLVFLERTRLPLLQHLLTQLCFIGLHFRQPETPNGHAEKIDLFNIQFCTIHDYLHRQTTALLVS
jgi:hypothetical protein